jgi:hypothetical protein
MNGGEFYIKELGYWLDRYDVNLNLVLEYDEKGHKYKKEKYMIRENEVKMFLKCNFFRIREENFMDDTKKLSIYLKGKINGQ